MVRAFAVAALATVAALFTARVAAAQTATVLSPYAPPPASSVLAPAARSDSSTLPPDAASLPLRLSLLTAAYPIGPFLGGSGCGEASVAAAGTVFPTQPYTQIQLTPHLVLHGFSDLGCPGDPFASLDSGAGGGLTYALRLRPSTWLVASAGGYVIPAHDPIATRATVGGGLDLVVQQPKSARVLTMGLGVTTSGRGVRVIPRVGGSF
jgi:hypothetical protein